MLVNIQIFPLVFDSSRLQEGIVLYTLVKLYNKANIKVHNFRSDVYQDKENWHYLWKHNNTPRNIIFISIYWNNSNSMFAESITNEINSIFFVNLFYRPLLNVITVDIY